MASRRMNVLVYAGTGCTISSVRHVTWTLRRLLGPNYAIITITAEQVLKEPWPATCALLVMPGGADLGYCRMLNGEGNARIKSFVQLGGAYLGLCAGGYYGSGKCEFEVGDRAMEVVGDRELAFFPGICRGLAFPGFVYASEAGAKAVELTVNREALHDDGRALPQTLRTYYNGGGVFVDAKKFKDKGVEVLADFTEAVAVDSGDGAAAVVYCKIGEGHVILTGPHPEFSGHNLDRDHSKYPNYPAIVDALIQDDTPRVDFFKACLARLGLEVSRDPAPVPSLSCLHLSAAQPIAVSELYHSWYEAGIVTAEGGKNFIKAENDTFRLEEAGRWDLDPIVQAVSNVIPQPVKDALEPLTSLTSASSKNNSEDTAQADSSPDRMVDYNAVTKRLVVHESELPDGKETPHFNHHAFFANLKMFFARHRRESEGVFGKLLLYGEVVTSTNTMLEKNPTLLSYLPDGFTATATTQVAGRGRGSNVWVSPPGSLMFSVLLRHSLTTSTTAPVVFVQYLTALAIVQGVHSYEKGYDRLPIKLKWPNDVYALDPAKDPREKQYVKICGILVNSSYSSGDYTLVVGVGINVNNTAPSTSLSALAKKAGLPSFSLEKLLASILVQFEEVYARFCRTGFDAQFENLYYQHWLHTNQIVTIDTEDGARAKIKGITLDWGLLIAEELGWQDRPTGRKWELQSDSNSFDFFKGLLRKKT